MSPVISGTVRPGFESVADAFRDAFVDEQMGSALCVFHHGEPVVDLWGGVADARDGRAWTDETISVIFSCTKGLMSIVAARLVEAGRLDYDAPVARYWPEFAASGKGDVRVRHLLNHQSGLSAPREDQRLEDILDWDAVTTLLAAQEPLWAPGTGYAYHAITHGWLIGEVVRRVSGQPVSAVFEEMIAPLHASAWIGLPEAEHRRVAHLVVAPTPPETAAARPQPDWLERAMTLGGALPPGLVLPDGGFNDPRLWSAEIPGAGGIASAHGLAKIWSATVWPTDGCQLLDAGTRARATAQQTAGKPVFEVDPPWPRWGMGFQLDSEARRYLTPSGFGHDGAGGQVAFAEPGLGIGFAFVTNRMEGPGDRRATAIVDALRALPGIVNSVPNTVAVD